MPHPSRHRRPRRRPGRRVRLRFPPALPAVLLGTLALLGGVAGTAGAATVERTIPVEGRLRSYLVHVPRALDPARPAPVLFVFHGAGTDAWSMVRATGFDDLADREGFLVVYPQAAGAGRRFTVGPPASGQPDDVAFLRALVARLRGRFRVDERRLFATGFSNGGMLCYHLAAECSDLLAAVAPVGAVLPPAVRPPRAPVALLHAHGTRDDRVPFGSGGGGRLGAAESVARWASWIGCGLPPVLEDVPEAAPLRVARVRYPCRGGADAHLLRLEGVRHAWPGEGRGWLSRAIWAFLAAHPRPAPPAPPTPR